jgi:uncharacterized protein YcbX
MRVAALYRYPVKGFDAESCETLHVLPGGRIAGDRALGLRFDDAEVTDDGWGTKLDFLALINTPGLAALRLRFDHEARRLAVTRGDEVLVDAVLDAEGRQRFAQAMERYVASLDDSPFATRPSRRPLRVVGDGTTARYQDREPGYVTMHGRASVDAVADALGQAAAATERRFRSNVALEGVDAWGEQDWIGRRVRIGAVDFDVEHPVTRCLATHANPATGERDVPVMKTLLRLYRSERPTFAVLTVPRAGGEIRVGDEVEVHDR